MKFTEHSFDVYEQINRIAGKINDWLDQWNGGYQSKTDFLYRFEELDQRGAQDLDYSNLLAEAKEMYEVWLDAPTLVYVNAYRITRHYGGPEEGGWWFDCGEPLGSLPCTSQREAKSKVDEMRAKFAHLAEGDINSVLEGAEVHVYIEEKFARVFPETRPHYE